MPRGKVGAHDPTDERTIQDHEFYRICATLLDKPLGETDWSTVPDPVREVVFGLAYIINALASYMPNLPPDADEQTRRAHAHWLLINGFRAANSLVGAILTGRDHPIFSFIRGCRGENASARPAELTYRSSKPYIFGAYRAIRELHGMSQREASKLVARCFGEYGPTLAPSTIKDTNEKLPKDICAEADRFRDHLLKSGGSPERICDLAAFTMKLALSPPSPPKGGYKSSG